MGSVLQNRFCTEKHFGGFHGLLTFPETCLIVLAGWKRHQGSKQINDKCSDFGMCEVCNKSCAFLDLDDANCLIINSNESTVYCGGS